MNKLLKNITENAFYNSKAKNLFEAEYSRRFAVVCIKSADFKFSWQSDLVEPLLLDLGNGLFCIGVDLNFVVVNSNEGTILLQLNLNDFFRTIKLLDKSILVATDMEIIEISRDNYEITKKINLPDTFEDFIESDNGIEALCFDDIHIPILGHPKVEKT